MVSHWTYTEISDKSNDLEQGDILDPSSGLRNLLKSVHPHFCDPKYAGFMVLTQTCDLVRRKGRRCNSKYVNVAVIRSLSNYLRDLLRRVCKEYPHDVLDKDSKVEAKRFLQRLINQNEQKLGLFYLYPDADAGIAESCVAVLRVNVALRSYEHYDLLVRARRGRLEREFQSKLRWLMGNLYSRVATRDWPNKRGEKLTKELLSECAPEIKWLSKEEAHVVTEGVSVDGLSEEEAKKKLKPHLPKSPREHALDEIIRQAQNVFGEVVTHGDLTKLRNRLNNNPVLSDLLK